MSVVANMIEYSLPMRWEDGFVDEMLSLSRCSTNRIAAFYGYINMPEFRSGRVPLPHQNVDLATAERLVGQVHAAGCSFYYLFNAPLMEETANVDVARLDDIVRATRCDAVVVADRRLAELIRDRHPDVKLHVSTVGDIRSVADVNPWLLLRPQRLVLHHDLPRQPHRLREMLDCLRVHSIVPEMMVTESCLFKCPWRREHYLALGRGLDDAEFHNRCRSVRIACPQCLLSPGSFVRPQDVRFYLDKFDVHHFKITGRSQSAEWLRRTASAYLRESFEGNLVELMGMDPTIFPSRNFTLDARALDGYLEELFASGTEDANESLALRRTEMHGGAL